MAVNSKIITTFEALEKSRKYCAYSERSQQDVRKKLQSWDIDETSLESIIATLIEENFLNEMRFARAYVLGKLRINHWGRVKIKNGLRFHQISPRCMQDALKELMDEEYREVMMKEAAKKAKTLTGTQALKQHKIAQFLAGKGFETDLCYEIAKLTINQNE